MKTRTISSIVYVIALLVIPPAFGQPTDPYYAFYPSNQGMHWKRFQHNVLGFSIDIPSDWVFGIVGQPPTAVILLYQQGLDTSKFATTYETIEIGVLPQQGISLLEAYRLIISGMRQKHAGFVQDSLPKEEKIGGLPALRFQYSWSSKSGFQIIEAASLVKSQERIYSITSRIVAEVKSKHIELRTKIINSFRPSVPKF